jgi:hypothetical protein
MFVPKPWSSARAFMVWAVISCAATLAPSPARAAFHLWELQELYTSSTGSLQFIEMRNLSNFENFVSFQSIMVTNQAGTQTNTYTIPAGSDLPGDTANMSLLFGTNGIEAAGGPAPDFIIPDNFLFPEGGSILFFGQNSGPYTALPTDGVLSRNWTGGDFINSPTNYAGQTGVVVVPEPTTLALSSVAAGIGIVCRRRSLRRALSTA